MLGGGGWVDGDGGKVIVSRGAAPGRSLLLDHTRDASEVRRDVGAGSYRDIFAHQDFPGQYQYY